MKCADKWIKGSKYEYLTTTREVLDFCWAQGSTVTTDNELMGERTACLLNLLPTVSGTKYS